MVESFFGDNQAPVSAQFRNSKNYCEFKESDSNQSLNDRAE